MREKYFFAKVKYYLCGKNKEILNDCFRNCGIKIGVGCNIGSNILTGEPYLISIGNDVTISSEVLFVTHDASVGKIFGKHVMSDVCGEINVGNNCFLGIRSTILYGVTLADNIIVAAGSVVTKSFTDERIIIAGNPAKKIGTWDDFETKIKPYALSLHHLSKTEKKEKILEDKSKIIRR